MYAFEIWNKWEDKKLNAITIIQIQIKYKCTYMFVTSNFYCGFYVVLESTNLEKHHGLDDGWDRFGQSYTKDSDRINLEVITLAKKGCKPRV
jgi:hypothetical protein